MQTATRLGSCRDARRRRRRAGLARAVSIGILVSGLWLAPSGCGKQRPLPPRDEEGLAVFPGSGPWRQRNLPLLKEYLATLPADAVGRPVRGITLSDGARWLEGYVFRGRPSGLEAGLHVALFETDAGVRAYMWLDENAEPLELPVCPGDDEGVRARELTGEVYTWKSLRPERGVIYSPCPPAAWLPGSTD